MTELLLDLWDHDPLLVVTGVVVLLLFGYIQILRFRMQVLRETISTMVKPPNEPARRGGCLGPALLMVAVLAFLFASGQ